MKGFKKIGSKLMTSMLAMMLMFSMVQSSVNATSKTKEIRLSVIKAGDIITSGDSILNDTANTVNIYDSTSAFDLNVLSNNNYTLPDTFATYNVAFFQDNTLCLIGNTPVTNVILNKSTMNLGEEKKETLTATITPTNATNKNVIWTSSDTTVATVSSTGEVNALKIGMSTITVETEDGSKKATCVVTVEHIHKAGTTWYKDDTSHWHVCTADDGEKMDTATHTFGDWVTDTPATATTAGSKHRDCVCGQTETEEIPATGVIPEKPVISAGAGSTHQISNGKDMTLTCTGKLEDLKGIYIDGKLVDASNYTLKSGSTILTLKASYLDTLSAGSHTLKFQYKDSISADTTFIVTAKATEPTNPAKDTVSPKTSDNSNTMLYSILVLLSGCTVAFVFRRKKQFNK